MPGSGVTESLRNHVSRRRRSLRVTETDCLTETDIADTIESLLHNGSEQSLVTACVALYKHKRMNRDDDTEWLEEAIVISDTY